MGSSPKAIETKMKDTPDEVDLDMLELFSVFSLLLSAESLACTTQWLSELFGKVKNMFTAR